MTEKETYDKYISDIEDFFDLPENIQDRLLLNSYFEYVPIWDRLDFEQKYMIIQRGDFEYEKLWNKLGIVERNNVIQFNMKFDWRKYTPQPNDDELNLLLNRGDFQAEEFFVNLSEAQKLRVCSRYNFDYKQFWNKLTKSMKTEIIKHNCEFDPELYFDELKNEYGFDYNLEVYGIKKETGEKTLLDIYCERNSSLPEYYEKIWNKLDKFQKMKITIKNKLFIVRDKNEIYQLLKTYPNQMLEFVKLKIIPSPNLFTALIEICFEELDIYIKDLAIDIFKSFALVNITDILQWRVEMSKGDRVEINMSPELIKLYPFCIVKVKEKLDIRIAGEDKKILPGFYFYDISSNHYTTIKDYHIVLRESKIERLLNNSSE